MVKICVCVLFLASGLPGLNARDLFAMRRVLEKTAVHCQDIC